MGNPRDRNSQIQVYETKPLTSDDLKEVIRQRITDQGECSAEAASGDDVLSIELDEQGRYKTSFHVAERFFKHIIGKNGKTLKQLENETKAKIIVPKQKNENLVILGADELVVKNASQRVKHVVNCVKKSIKFTHFVSIPLNSDDAKNNFNKFKEGVLNECKDSRGINESIFVSGSTLHVTIGIMRLLEESEITKAAEVLQECQDQIVKPLLGGKALKISLTGLDCMQKNPAAVRVLFAKVSCPDQENIVHELVSQIADHCTNSGVMIKERKSINIHCTLMNVKFSKKRQNSFDASTILEKFKDFDFGQQVVTRIDISTLGARDESGYYRAAASINLSE